MKTITAREIQQMVFYDDIQLLFADIKEENDEEIFDRLPIIMRIKDYKTGEVWDGHNMNTSAVIASNQIILEFVKKDK